MELAWTANALTPDGEPVPKQTDAFHSNRSTKPNRRTRRFASRCSRKEHAFSVALK